MLAEPTPDSLAAAVLRHHIAGVGDMGAGGGLGVITVALWGNGGLVVSLVRAYLLLGEALSVRILMGALLILAALLMAGAMPVSNPEVA